MDGVITDDFQRLIVEGIPLIDVRAPVEFQAGTVPDAVNLPLLQDNQRHLVGQCYRRQGKDAAVALGHQLLQGSLREQVVADWLAFLARHPDAHLYCSRGGMRSAIACQWIGAEQGWLPPRLAGGYKALRNFLLANLAPDAIQSVPVVLGGRTGSGKTLLLKCLENSVDLEELANHRGSSFGAHISEQPTQSTFENRLAVALVRHRHRQKRCLVIEDEGRHVGKRFLPRDLACFFAVGSLVLLEVPLGQRIDAIAAEYVDAAQAAYCRLCGEGDGLSRWLVAMDAGAVRLAKRLGGERLSEVRRLLREAYDLQMASGDRCRHRAWVKLLLTDYYDPMYDFQISKKSERIVFRGGRDEVLGYLRRLETR